MNKSTLAIAIAALLVGGVAVAAFQHMRQPETVAARLVKEINERSQA